MHIAPSGSSRPSPAMARASRRTTSAVVRDVERPTLLAFGIALGTALAWLFVANIAHAVVSPPDGITLKQIHVQFEWTPIADADEYQIEVYLVEGGAPLSGTKVADETVPANRPRAMITTGLEFGESYEWHVRETAGSFGDVHSFNVAAIPAYMPTIQTNESGGDLPPEPGLTMFGIQSTDGSFPNGFAVAVDLQGELKWFMERDGGVVRDFRLLENGRLMFFQLGLPGRAYRTTLSGTTGWASPNSLELDLHHEAFPMPNGDVLSIAYNFAEVTRDEELQVWKGDRYVIMDHTTNAEKWSWDAFDYLDTVDFDAASMLAPNCPGCASSYPTTYPWTHSNAVIYDEGEDVVYGGFRHLSRIVKIDRKTGDILFQMGTESGTHPTTLEPLMPSGDVDFGDDLFSMSHAHELLPNGNLVLYDNGNRRGHFDHSLVTGSTKAVELSFSGDPIANASIAWSVEMPFYTPALGDADRQPGDTTLMTQGFVGKLFEADLAGNFVWDLSFQETALRLYRAERIPSLLVDGPQDRDGDGVADLEDNCPDHANPIQADCDGNGLGDVCTLALNLQEEDDCASEMPEFDVQVVIADSFENFDPEFSGATGVWTIGGATTGRRLAIASDDSTVPISDDAFDNFDYDLSAAQVSWTGIPATGEPGPEESEIFHFDGARRTRLTDNSVADGSSAIAHSQVIWVGDDRSGVGEGKGDSEIFHRDMEADDESEEQITDNNLEEADPDISLGRGVWLARTGNFEVMIDDGESVTAVTNDTFPKRNLHLDGASAVWEAWDGTDWEIYFYDGADVIPLTDNLADDVDPQISSAGIVYTDASGGVSLRRDSGTIQLTTSGHSARISQLSAAYVDTTGADAEVYLYDLGTDSVVYNTDNDVEDTNPAVTDDAMAWESDGGVRLYDGADTQLAVSGQQPTISPSFVVWTQWHLDADKNPIERRETDLWMYDGISVTQLTLDDVNCSQFPKLSGDHLIYERRSYVNSYDNPQCEQDPMLVHRDLMTTPTLAEDLNLCEPAHLIMTEDICQGALFGDQIVWRESRFGWDDSEIMAYDGAETSIVTTRNRRAESDPVVSSGGMAWLGFPDPDWEVYTFDGEELLQLTDNDLDEECPVLSGERIAWVAREPDDDGAPLRNGQIFLYDGYETQQLTVSEITKDCPVISGSRVAWGGGQTQKESDIFLYDGNQVVQITSDPGSGVYDREPQISGAYLTWQRAFDTIAFYNGSEFQVISDENGKAYDPRIAGGSVVWRHNTASGSNPPQEIVAAEIIPTPEPGMALLQLVALATVVGLRSRRR